MRDYKKLYEELLNSNCFGQAFEKTNELHIYTYWYDSGSIKIKTPHQEEFPYKHVYNILLNFVKLG